MAAAEEVLGRVTLVTGKEEFLNQRTVEGVRRVVRAFDPEAEVSMAEIARRSGVGSATLYRNFAIRRDLLEALYVDEVDADRRAAEHMLASLGREFRRNARKGRADAFVINANADGSLKITESRVLEAGSLVSMLIRLSLSWTVGFLGLV